MEEMLAGTVRLLSSTRDLQPNEEVEDFLSRLLEVCAEFMMEVHGLLAEQVEDPEEPEQEEPEPAQAAQA